MEVASSPFSIQGRSQKNLDGGSNLEVEYLKNTDLRYSPYRMKITHTQNVPLGINIKNEQCVYLSSWSLHTAVYAAYERYNPTVLLRLANFYFWSKYWCQI